MPVNEALWLTRRVEIAVMVILLFFCFVADVSKCKSGYFPSCIGGWASLCDRDVEKEWCYDYVVAPVDYGVRAKCDCTPHTSSLLFHVLEVGAPIGQTLKSGAMHSVPIAPYVATALRQRLGDAMLSNSSHDLFGASYFAPLRRDIELEAYKNDLIGAMCESPAARTVNISYSHDTVALSTATDLLSDLATALPFKNDYFAIRRYFPGLHRTFERLIAGISAKAASKQDPCALVHLVFLLTFTPGPECLWADENASHVADVLLRAQTYIRRAMSRYLRKKPRYTRFLSTVTFVTIPMGYPLSGGEPLLNASEMVASICPAAGKVGSRRCRAACAQYQQEIPTYKKVHEDLRRMTFDSSARRPQLRTFLLPYNDYFSNSSAGNATWHDCLYLNPNGVAQTAERIVDSVFLE